MSGQRRVARVLLLMVALGDLLAGAALLAMPAWFFENIGRYPPFNRHYAGDTGAFVLALGLVVLVAARDPQRYVPVVWAATLGHVLHFANHLYDDTLAAAWSPAHLFGEVLPQLVLPVLLLALAAMLAARNAGAAVKGKERRVVG